MSRTIDERIVDMQFNNKQFESGIRDSLGSLDSLKKGLSGMDGGALAGLSSAVDTVSDRFSALGIAGMAAIVNITNKVVDLGAQMLKSVTVDPIAEGFGKYERMVEAQQTIINATGLGMETVADELERLNKFTDETSFRLDDMVTNIGKFTGVGIELDTAVTAMQGIGNYAALSGMNIEKTSSAMGVFAKSVGQGFMQLKEWKQLENMNGATMEFKQTLLDTAVEAGTLIKVFDKETHGEDIYSAQWIDPLTGKMKDAQVTIADFTQALTSSRWLNADVMLSAMDKYGAASTEVLKIMEEQDITANQAIKQVEGLNEALKLMAEHGMTAGEAIKQLEGQYEFAPNAIEKIEALGNAQFDLGLKAFKAAQEAKTFTDAINSVRDAVSTGWMNTFQIIFGNYEEAKELWTNVADELWEVFAGGAEARNEMLKEWKKDGGRDALLEGFGNLYEAIMAIVEPIRNAWDDIFPPMTAERLLAITEGFRNLMERLIVSEETADKLQRTFAGLFAVVGFVGDGIKFLFGILGELLGRLAPVGDGFLDTTAKIGDFLVSLREGGSVAEAFQRALELVGQLLDWIGEKISGSVSAIAGYFAQFSGIDLGPLRVFSGEVEMQFRPFTFIADIFRMAINGIIAAWEFAKPVFEKIGQVLGVVAKAIKDFAAQAGINSFADIFNPVMLGMVVVAIKNFLDSFSLTIGNFKSLFGDVKKMLGGVTKVLDGVRGSLEAYQTKLKAQALLNIALAVAALAGAIWVLSTIDATEMAHALGAITVLFAELAGVMLILSNVMGLFNLLGVATSMIAISAAVLILSAACKNLAGLNWDELIVGLSGIAVLMLELSMFMKLMGDGAGLMKIGIAMIPLATGLLILSQAVKSLAGLEWDELVRGLAGLGGALVIIAGVSKLVEPAKLLAMGAAMIGLGAGLLLISGAMLAMSILSWGDLAKGLIGIGGALVAIAGVSRLVDPVKLLAMSVALVGVGAALTLIAGAMLLFGTMSWESMAKSLIMLAGSLVILGAASLVMSKGLAGAAAMMAMAVALAILTPSLVILGMMDLENIGRALLMLVGVFAVFGIAALALGPIVPVMLALGGAIALIGVGVGLLGAGLLALAIALGMFAAAGAAGIAALTYILETLIMFVPRLIIKIGEGLVQLLDVIIAAVPRIMEAAKQIILGIIMVLTELIPPLLVAVFEFLDALLTELVIFIPKLVDAGMKMLLGILEGIASNIQEVVAAALLVVAEFLRGIAEGLPGIADAAVDIIVAFIKAIGVQTPRIIEAGFVLIIDFLNGLADAIRNNTHLLVQAAINLAGAIIEGIVKGLLYGVKAVIDAIVNVAKAIWDGFKNFFGIKSPSTLMEKEGGNVISGLVKGFGAGIGKVTDKAKELGKAFIEAAGKAFEGIKDVASNVVDSLSNGIKAGTTAVGNAAKNVANSALNGAKNLLGIKSPSKEFTTVGTDSAEGLIVGLKVMESAVGAASEDVAGTALDSMKDTMRKLSDIMSSDIDMTPVITPVIDMGDVEKGIHDTFGKRQTLDLGTSIDKVSQTSAANRRAEERRFSSGDTSNTDNSQNGIEIINHYHVRDDSDISKINRGLSNILDKYHRTKGVPVTA